MITDAFPIDRDQVIERAHVLVRRMREKARRDRLDQAVRNVLASSSISREWLAHLRFVAKDVLPKNLSVKIGSQVILAIRAEFARLEKA
jgi:hypothetical protein